VLQENQRRPGRWAKAAIGEADSSAFNVTGGRRFKRGDAPRRDFEVSHFILRMLGMK
jgi:hypothetical protein